MNVAKRAAARVGALARGAPARGGARHHLSGTHLEHGRAAFRNGRDPPRQRSMWHMPQESRVVRSCVKGAAAAVEPHAPPTNRCHQVLAHVCPRPVLLRAWWSRGPSFNLSSANHQRRSSGCRSSLVFEGAPASGSHTCAIKRRPETRSNSITEAKPHNVESVPSPCARCSFPLEHLLHLMRGCGTGLNALHLQST